MAIPESDLLAKVEEIVRSDLSPHYKKWFNVNAYFQGQDFIDDETYLRIYIVFDGKAKDLRIPAWTQGLISRIRDKLAEQDIHEFPVLSPVAKSEWDASKHNLVTS